MDVLVVQKVSATIPMISIFCKFGHLLLTSAWTYKLTLTILSISTPDLKYFLGAMLLSTATWPANWTSFRTLSAGSRSSAILMFLFLTNQVSPVSFGRNYLLSPEIVSYYGREQVVRYVSCTRSFWNDDGDSPRFCKILECWTQMIPAIAQTLLKGLYGFYKEQKYCDVTLNAPIIGLPQDGRIGQPRGIRLRKAHVGWDFHIHNDPQGGKFDSTAILKNWEDLGMSDEWCATLENTQNCFERVSRVQGWLNESYEGVLCCFLIKNVILCPSVLCFKVL